MVSVVLTVVLVILAVVLAVVGVQVVLVLNEIRKTLRKVNDTVDMAEEKINSVIAPIQSLGGVASNVQTGFKVFETFVGWLDRKRESGK